MKLEEGTVMREDDMTDEELLMVLDVRGEDSLLPRPRIMIPNISEFEKKWRKPNTVPLFASGHTVKDFTPGITQNASDYSEIVWFPEYSRNWKIAFAETEALENVQKGSLIRFHDEQTAKTVHKIQEKDSQLPRGFASSILVCTVVFSALWWFLSVPTIFAGSNFISAFLATIGIVIATLLSSIIVNSGVFWAIGAANSKKLLEITNTKQKDEWFLLEHNSLALEMLKRSDIFLNLVKNKVLSYPTSEELDSWCREVDALLKVQEDFPKDMIPAMSEDVTELRGAVTEKLAELEAEKVEALAIEKEASSYGTDVVRSGAVDDSKATLAGALSFVQSMSVNDTKNHRKD